MPGDRCLADAQVTGNGAPGRFVWQPVVKVITSAKIKRLSAAAEVRSASPSGADITQRRADVSVGPFAEERVSGSVDVAVFRLVHFADV